MSRVNGDGATGRLILERGSGASSELYEGVARPDAAIEAIVLEVLGPERIDP